MHLKINETPNLDDDGNAKKKRLDIVYFVSGGFYLHHQKKLKELIKLKKNVLYNYATPWIW
jgi:hypothetical protein